MYQFNEKQPTPLCEIMGRHKSDKGHVNIRNSWHNYTTFYYSIFKDMRTHPLRIFELGLGTNNVSISSNMGPEGTPGASLRGWKEFFANSQIFGADIDRDILFEEDRINTFYCDQTDPDSIADMWNMPELRDDFDIIVEDGLHTPDAAACFFENSIHKLKSGGYYIIEDINSDFIDIFTAKVDGWKQKYPASFQIIRIPSTQIVSDNNLLVVKKA